jgi:hypothetical protein
MWVSLRPEHLSVVCWTVQEQMYLWMNPGDVSNLRLHLRSVLTSDLVLLFYSKNAEARPVWKKRMNVSDEAASPLSAR